jgi:carboxymethylenebutenolidase
MGEMVEFPSNGQTAQGYLATPSSGSGPGVVVIQEWWGLVPHIKDVCDRYAREGFTALAVDLYHGQTTEEPDEAGKLMMEMDVPRGAQEIGGGA